MNNVSLIGRLATDVKLKEVSEEVGGGNKVKNLCNFIIAVDRDEEEVDFFRVKVWNSLAEAVALTIRKGDKVAIEGLLRQDTYYREDDEGIEREHKTVAVVARRIELL